MYTHTCTFIFSSIFPFFLIVLNDRKIQHMYETVLNHDGAFQKAKQVHLFCLPGDDDEPISFTNSPKRERNLHAEELLIDYLNKLKKRQKSPQHSSNMDMTVYINNSPCSSVDHNCAMKLRNFLNENRHASLKLYITHLFKILRVSCEKNCHHQIDDDYYANTCGLWNLIHHKQCEVRAYDKAVWEELLKSGNFPFSRAVKRALLENYDVNLNNDYIKHNRSRKEEDQLIKKDLDAIGGYRSSLSSLSYP